MKTLLSRGALVFLGCFALSIAACTNKQSSGAAEPAEVDVEWPDAAPIPASNHDDHHDGEDHDGHEHDGDHKAGEPAEEGGAMVPHGGAL